MSGSTTARGYGGNHVAARRRWLELLRQLGALQCTRCAQPVYFGDAVDLDHTDDRSGYLGLAHRGCNRSAGASKGGRIRTDRQRAAARRRTSRDWF